jgi:type I restriction enzyme S subunit
MKLKPGYKQTEVGVIPEEWQVSHLAGVCSMKSGSGITSADIDQFSQYPCYGGNGLRGFTTRFTHDGSYALIGRQGALCGNVQGVEGKFFASEHAVVVTAFPQTDIHWLTYVLGKMRLNQYSESSAQPGLSVQKVLALELALPPTKDEQRAIAGALGDVDALLGALEQLLAKKRDLKQAAMQQLLTGQTRLPGFTGKWETKTLGELGKISGAGVDKKIRPGEPPVRLVNYMDVYRRNFIYSKDLNHVVSARPDQAARCAVKQGDVYFTPSSEMPYDIAVSAIAMEDIPDAAYSYHVVRLRLDDDWDLLFRAYAFKSQEFLNQAARACEGSGVRYVITQGKFRQLSVRFPPQKEEQAAIGAVLSDMDGEVGAVAARLAKTRALKQGMMQELLTGRTRLIENG